MSNFEGSNAWEKSRRNKWSHLPQVGLFCVVALLLVVGAVKLSGDPDFNITSEKIILTTNWERNEKRPRSFCKDRDYKAHHYFSPSGEKHSIWEPKCYGERGDIERGAMAYISKNYEKSELLLKRSIKNKEAPRFAYHLLGEIEIDRGNKEKGCSYLQEACKRGECEYYRYLQGKRTCKYSRVASLMKKNKVQKMDEIEMMSRGKSNKFIYDIN